MRSDRNRAGSRKNKARKHHGKKGRQVTVEYRESDDHWNQPVANDRRQELLGRPNQEPTSTPIEQFWGPRELIKLAFDPKRERGSLVGQLDEHLQPNG